MEANEISLDLEYEKRDENGKLEYEGISFVKDGFPAFLKQTISPIYKDEDYNAHMKEVAIGMTGFDSENLRAVFDTMPKVSNFRIGELVAEKILESRYSAKFTYNSDRDLKNPNSNNTGADIVGFIEMEDGVVNFLFGEVKTSEEHTNPPGVMYGSTGMINQLVELGTNSDKLKSLVKWIFIKCNSDKDLLVQKYIREVTNSAEIQLEKKMVLSDEALIDVTRSNLNKMKLAIASTKRLADRKGVLVIGGHVKDCWNIAHALYEELELECNDNDVELVKKYVAAEYGEEFELMKLLSKGIAVHHFGLSDEVRVLIEWLMERGKLNILVATTTIAQGINFPVSTIIMASIAYPYMSEMPVRDFWNLVGRAGRAGQNDVGIIGITIGARNDNQKQEELAKLTRYVKKSTEELVSQLQKIAENTIEFGKQFSLTDQFYNPEWSQFLQYITHMFNQCKDLGEFEEKTELFLRRTFGYSNIEPKKQKILLSAVKEYGEVLNKNKGLAKLSDSTGFSMETLGRTAYRIKELGIRQDNLKGSSLFGNDSQLKDLIGIMMNIPEISKNMQNIIAKGNRNLSGDMIARLTTDWVNGTKLETLASQYFGDDRDAMTECCQAIYGKLVNSATWGLSTIQKLGINEDSLSEEELQKAANLPAMIYYGVNSDEAILMRMNNVPRSVAAEMGVEYKKDFDNIYKQSSYEIRQWIEGLSSDKWDAFAENKRGMSGSDYRAIWKVLNNES